ncbi:MAG: 6-phosphofructokinase, partial [Spirochaetales bacterium]|nr:6-phosphofructokinase [Spirochaetales bacterium]
FATDHTPGYPSAARYVALSVQQAGRLAADMQRVDRFVIHQTVGREAGWLAAASAVARRSAGDAPHLIYVPEQPLTRDGVLVDVERTVGEYGWASIVVGEGILWEDGTPVSAAASKDRFDNLEFGAMSGSSAAVGLHRLISEQTGYRGEFQIPESMAMAAADRVVATDRREAYGCGVEAVSRAVRGENNVMVTIEREESAPYRVHYGAAPLSEVAVRAKPMPPDMLVPAWVSDRFLDYVRPLVGSLDRYVDLGGLPPVAVDRGAAAPQENG